MTLVEVMISMLIVAMVTLGTLGTLLTARQMADFARKRMMVDAAMQGVMEQLKNRDVDSLLPIEDATARAGSQPAWFASMTAMKAYISAAKKVPSIPVTLANDTNSPLTKLILSPDSQFMDPRNIPAGAVPASVDTDGFGDINGDSQPDVGVNRLTLHMRNPGAAKTQSDDINVYIMVWIKDTSIIGDPTTIRSLSIFLNYTWTYKEGAVTKKMIDSIRAFRIKPV